MTSSSPNRLRRASTRRLFTTAGSFVAAGALALTAGGPAFADPAPSDSRGEHVATSRIATVEWCGTGVVGDVSTDRATDGSTADWSSDPAKVGGAQHFTEPPGTARSAVSRDATSLTASATLENLRFDPDCARAPEGGDNGGERPGASGGRTIAEVFDAEELVELGSARSTSTWSAAGGAAADLRVDGLEVLDRPADVSDGAYERTFTQKTSGGALQVGVTATPRVNELAHGVDWTNTAYAWLDIRFQVAKLDADGDRTAYREYRLGLANTSAHSQYDADPAPAPPAGDGESATPPQDGRTTGEPGPAEDGASSPPSEGEQRERGAPPSAESSDTPTPDPSPSASEPPADSAGDQPKLSPDVNAPLPSDSGGRLPVTGTALVGLIGAGLAALGSGATAIYLGRSRKAGIDGDDIGD